MFSATAVDWITCIVCWCKLGWLNDSHHVPCSLSWLDDHSKRLPEQVWSGLLPSSTCGGTGQSAGRWIKTPELLSLPLTHFGDRIISSQHFKESMMARWVQIGLEGHEMVTIIFYPDLKFYINHSRTTLAIDFLIQRGNRWLFESGWLKLCKAS